MRERKKLELQGLVPCKSRHQFPVHSCKDPVPPHRCPPACLSGHSHRPHSLESPGNPGSTGRSLAHRMRAYTGNGQWAHRTGDWLTLHHCNCRPERRKKKLKWKGSFYIFVMYTHWDDRKTLTGGELYRWVDLSRHCYMDSLRHMPAGGKDCIVEHLCVFVARAHWAKTVTWSSVCFISLHSPASSF